MTKHKTEQRGATWALNQEDEKKIPYQGAATSPPIVHDAREFPNVRPTTQHRTSFCGPYPQGEKLLPSKQ